LKIQSTRLLQQSPVTKVTLATKVTRYTRSPNKKLHSG